MHDRIGEQLGNYRLTRLLGTGGFAEVYLGEHLHLGTEAAIKVLHTRLEQNDADTFRNEARLIARLKHPHIVRVLDFGLDNLIPYLVMDYASQGSLRARYPKGTSLPLPMILSYIRQIADALQYAHDQKLIHRDIKPENILVDEQGNLVISDFGIATIAQSSRSQNTQNIVGTVAYMAPEQIQGRPRMASDQYSLGIVVYEWLAGTRPFKGTFTEIATQHVLTPPPPPRQRRPDLPPAVEQVVMTVLQKDPHQRFGSVKAFAVAFEQACQQGQAGTFSTEAQLAPTLPAREAPPVAPPPTMATNVSTPPASQREGQVIMPTHPVSSASTPRSPKPMATPIERRAPPPPVYSYSSSKSAQPKKFQGRRRLLFALLCGGLAIVLIIVPFWIHSASTSTPFSNFHQTVTTSADITSILVGSNYLNGARPEVVSDTFHPGDAVYLVCTLTQLGANLADTLSVSNTPISTSGGEVNFTNSAYYDWTTVQVRGIYTWIVDYQGANGRPEQASLTFQVV